VSGQSLLTTSTQQQRSLPTLSTALTTSFQHSVHCQLQHRFTTYSQRQLWGFTQRDAERHYEGR